MHASSDTGIKHKDHIRAVDPLMFTSLLGALGCSDGSIQA